MDSPLPMAASAAASSSSSSLTVSQNLVASSAAPVINQSSNDVSTAPSTTRNTKKGGRRGGGARQQQQQENDHATVESTNETSAAVSTANRPNKKSNQTKRGGNKPQKGSACVTNNERHNLKQNTDSTGNDISTSQSDKQSSNGGSNGRQKASTGRRKPNLNHLLNFTYESARDSNDNYYEYERFGRQFWSTKLNKNSFFSKEQFLQANCQFVVKSNDTTDYSMHMQDPDRLVDWDRIEEVLIDTHASSASSSTLSCPICLHEPTAGKMTKCGHVYCWPCILHYLSLSDKPWRKCPICNESIYKSDLKSVRVVARREYRPGDEIDMQLVFRPRALKFSTLCMPFSVLDRFESHMNSTNSVSYSVLSNWPECSPYLKIHARSPLQIYEEVVKRERVELERQYEAEKNQPEVCFVSEALSLLGEREAHINEEIKGKCKRKEAKLEKEQVAAKNMNEDENVLVKVDAQPSIRYVDAFDEEVLDVQDEIPKVVNSEDNVMKSQSLPNKEEEKVLSKEETNKYISSLDLSYFYQSVDGQRIFINGFNTRCLLTEYTSLNRAPQHIRARIITSDSMFMSDETRRQRYKYLSHLPLHTEFKIVELDLENSTAAKNSYSNYLSTRTLELMRDEFDERRRLRERKQAREKRECDRLAAQAAEREYNAQHYYVASAMSAVVEATRPKEIFVPGVMADYLNEFPEASSSPPFSSGASLVSENSSAMSTASNGSTSATSSNSDTSSSTVANSASASSSATATQVSFAQMLKHPEAASTRRQLDAAWPALEHLSISSSVTPLPPPPPPPPSSTANTIKSAQSVGATTHLGGWVTMAKQQQAQMSMSGRAKRCQNAPAPWSLSTSSDGSLAASALARTSGSGDDDESEAIAERECMPAPSFKQSFFSAIDESLKLIETSKKENTEETKTSTTNKKKKKTKQLLFSTALNFG